MAAAAEVQSLLRFLTKDARLPLPEAMPKIHPLRKLDLNTPDKIALAQNADLKVVFTDEKVLKQVVNAAKRISNPKKNVSKSRNATSPQHSVSGDLEASLQLPKTDRTEETLQTVNIETNRAPLFLAFTLTLLNYTHPEQPISSKLSLAQAVVSAGAQSKAKSIGLTSGPTAEEDGWALGQPKIRIMGREVAVMRRHTALEAQPEDKRSILVAEDQQHDQHEAFWGIDLEALRKSNGPLIAGKNSKGQTGPPIHTPQSARNYLLKSMDLVQEVDELDAKEPKSPKTKKPTSAEIVQRKEDAAAMVLKAIDVVCASWKDTLTLDELDRRAQSWYSLTRPEVKQGQAGWGQRGQVSLADILRLKRPI